MEKPDRTPGPLKMEHGGPPACSDCNTEMDSYSKEQVSCPQSMSRDSAQPGTLSTLEPSGSDREHPASNETPDTLDGSRSECRGSPYPSNHDRMLASLKKSMAPPERKGTSSWTLSRLCEPDSTDLPPSSALTPSSPQLTEASSGFPHVPSEGQHLLLSNGHLSRACDSSLESIMSLTGQLPGKRNVPLLFAPKI